MNRFNSDNIDKMIAAADDSLVEPSTLRKRVKKADHEADDQPRDASVEVPHEADDQPRDASVEVSSKAEKSREKKSRKVNKTDDKSNGFNTIRVRLEKGSKIEAAIYDFIESAPPPFNETLTPSQVLKMALNKSDEVVAKAIRNLAR